MENRNIIIILLVIIVVLAAAIGFALFNPTHAKEPTKIKITSDKEQYKKNAKLSIELKDLNKTPLSKEIVNVTITDKKGEVVVDDVVKTDKKGKVKLELDLKKGKYKVNVTYGGNENYTGNSTTQKLTIKEKEKVVEAEPEPSQATEQVDYNSPNSNYFKSDVDGSYHEKQEGAKYIYAQDAITGEWSYWADKN